MELSAVRAFLAREDAAPAAKIERLVTFLAGGDGGDDGAYVDPLAAEQQQTQAQIDALLERLAPATPASKALEADDYVDPLTVEKEVQDQKISALVDALAPTLATAPSASATTVLVSADGYEDPLTTEKQQRDQEIDDLLNELTQTTPPISNALEADAYVDLLTEEKEAKDQQLDKILDALEVNTTTVAASSATSSVVLARNALAGEYGDSEDYLHVTLGAVALVVLGILLAVMTKRSEKLVHTRRSEQGEQRDADFYVLLK